MHETGTPHWLPIDHVGRKSRERRVATIIENSYRTRHRSILDEVNTEATAGQRSDVVTVDTMTAQLSPHSLTPYVIRQCRYPRHSQTEASAGRCDIRLSATDLNVELSGRLDTFIRWD
jgi:hypothetical protein